MAMKAPVRTNPYSSLKKSNTSKVKEVTKRMTTRAMTKLASNIINVNKTTKKVAESAAKKPKVVDN